MKGIIHRDLKLENVLFGDKERTLVKVVDFGISGRCKGNAAEKNNAGTLPYMAPEVLMGHATFASPAQDVWAIGVMLFAMIFHKFPFKDVTPEGTRNQIVNEPVKFKSSRKRISEECKDLLR